MDNNVSVSLSHRENCFVISIGDTTVRASPRQFSKLLEEAIAAAAQHIDAHSRETGRTEKKKGTAIEAIRSTRMDASADLGAVQIVTRIEIGQLALHFAAPRNTVMDYCIQVMGILQAAAVDIPRGLTQ